MRRRQIPIFLSILSLSLFAASLHADGRSQQRKESRKEIEHLESEWRKASIKNDIAVLERLLADDFIGISAIGTLQTKQQLIASRQADRIHFDKIEYSDTKIRVYGDSAVVTTTAEVQGRAGAAGDPNTKDISGKYRYTRVYTRHNNTGTWRIVSFESSRVKNDQ